MTDDSSKPPLPTPGIHQSRRWSLSLIWLVPLIAALAGIILLLRAWLASGPEIVISFKTAEGLAAGSTEVRYKDVVVGKVQSIRLSDDHQSVLVSVELSRDAASLAAADSRFWVVRPRIGFGGVSGLNTIFSGAYIGVDVGRSEERRSEFEGYEKPPAVTSDQQGRRYILEADDLGSLDIGSPVYYRRRQVGRVVDHQLRADGRGVTIEVFVDAPFDRYVSKDSRFWNASGIDLSIGAAGLKLDTEAMATVLAGGIAFEAPPTQAEVGRAEENRHYTLFADRSSAMAPLDGIAMDIRMRFARSIRGLAVGAPIDFRGVALGNVTALTLAADPHGDLYALVDARIYPERLGALFREQIERSGAIKTAGPEFFAKLIARGLRAQLQPGNLLTGQLYVSLDFQRKSGPAGKPDLGKTPFEIPSVPGSIDQIQQQIASIVSKLDAVPFDDIGQNLNSSLRNADSLLKQLDKQTAPQAQQVLSSAHAAIDKLNQNLLDDQSPLQRDSQNTLRAVEQMARSMRELADYLNRHPDSLLFGKSQDAEPAAVPIITNPPQDAVGAKP